MGENDSGSSSTYPVQAGNIKKGGHLMIKGRPCKVIDVSTSKTGKHGHAKAHFIAIDIFTNKKMEELCPSSHNIDVPFIKRTEYTVIDINDDNYVVLVDEEGNTKEDLQINTNDDIYDCLINKINIDGEAIVTVVSAIGEERIISCK